uniref:P2X purinoceptor n=2 Tax=Noctiluca scintillans TaxID=2966 RepID=A0A7S1ALD8_NOCSC|mmetsp:Transcript_51070/g.136217  ORF Transcript_51070/g.136217 Transcript_51070/m.136217 type:complete len:383 (+) Transcript_51070:57-1205(+)
MAGTELPSVVDEDDDRVPDPGLGKTFRWDDFFPYTTYKMVKIKDRWLGLLYWSIVTVVVFYIIVVAVVIEGKHQTRAQGVGTVITRFWGKAFLGQRALDVTDLRSPLIEPKGAFIMTKRIVVNQSQGQCVDWDQPRQCPCSEGTCVAGYCQVQAWCPSLGDQNADSPPNGAVVETVEGLGHMHMKIMAGITFPEMGTDLFIYGHTDGAEDRFSNLTIAELLSLSDPPLLVEDITDSGALLAVSFNWDCEVTMDCEPTVVVKRLDTAGFVQKHSNRRGDGQTREAIYMFGLRILITSSGIGRQFSIQLIVVQIGSGLALLRISALAADFMMLRCFRDGLTRRAYRKCKVIATNDLSDLRDRLHHIKTKSRVRHRTGTNFKGDG